jgi:hypothetical protein
MGAPARAHRAARVKLIGWVLLGLLAAQTTPAQDPRPAPARRDLSWAEADRLTQALAQVEARFQAGGSPARDPLVVTERQVNSYVNLTLGAQHPPGLDALEVKLLPERVLLRANVDLARLPIQRPAGAWSPLDLLSGVVPVELLGRLASGAGALRVELEDARLGGVGIPPSLVAQIVTASTRSSRNPEGVDPALPLSLPYGIQRLRLLPGRVVVEFQPPR